MHQLHYNESKHFLHTNVENMAIKKGLLVYVKMGLNCVKRIVHDFYPQCVSSMPKPWGIENKKRLKCDKNDLKSPTICDGIYDF